MITGQQIRSARAALNWSAQILAESSGVSLRTLMRLEQTDGVPASRASTLIEIQRTFETAGIEFIGSPDDRPGIRFSRAAAKSPP
jgi:transcriptional regulator with XRE-family HTH domain